MERALHQIGAIRTYSCRKFAGGPAAWRPEDWAVVPAAEPFILASGAGEASLQTQVRAVWTDDSLYLMFWCEDPEPWATMSRRDDSLYEEEVVEVFIAPGPEPTTYFEFEINPLGTLFDAAIRWRGPGAIEVRRAWDCAGLTGGAGIEPGGWRAWLVIPFAGLDARPASGDVWAVNFYRIERRPCLEFSSWSPLFTHPPEYHTPSRFGRILFVAE